MEEFGIITRLRHQASLNPKRIVLPEGEDVRIIEAAQKILKEKIARLVIFTKNKVDKSLEGYSKSGYLEVLNPESEEFIDKYASLYFEARRHKEIDFEVAKRIIRENPVYSAALMVKSGEVDGSVAGASLSTSDVARAAIHCIGKQEGISTVLGIFIMVIPDSTYGEKGTFVFADCAVVPNPNSTQLADIAVATAEFTAKILGIEPRVAMLSYSSKGSSNSSSVDTIIEATKIVKEKYPQLLIDGELQVDAAIVPEVARIKTLGSKVAGFANVLVFPNLEAANCSYKLVQRLARARAVGPVFLGLMKPASDLSRGCDVEDIIDAVAVTVIRAQK